MTHYTIAPYGNNKFEVQDLTTKKAYEVVKGHYNTYADAEAAIRVLELTEYQPYYRLWIAHNNGNDPCNDNSCHEYIIWIQGQWNEYFNGQRPAHITNQDHQLFLHWLTRKVTGI